jgi:hypothetical protein
MSIGRGPNDQGIAILQQQIANLQNELASVHESLGAIHSLTEAWASKLTPAAGSRLPVLTKLQTGGKVKLMLRP